MPDALGYIFSCTVHSVGWFGRSLPWHLTLALAGCIGCSTGGWFGHDPPAGRLLLSDQSPHPEYFQTLSRLHVCATLAFSQVIGSICVMIARATAPNRVGPGSVFPDAAKWDFEKGLKGKGEAYLSTTFITHSS